MRAEHVTRSAREVFPHAVELRDGDDGAADAQDLARGDVLAGLRHDALVGSDDEQDELHPGRARDHGVHEPAVAGDVDDADGHPVAEIPRSEAEFDGDAAAFLLREAVGVDACERRAGDEEVAPEGYPV